jgi:peptidoglycan/xylan/chitin deacetylase (PgdA/CDA1 family)
MEKLKTIFGQWSKAPRRLNNMNSIINKIAFWGMILFRRFAYVLFGVLAKFTRPHQTPVILCYHGLSNDAWRFSVELDVFKKQMSHMLTFAKPVTLKSVSQFIKGDTVFDGPTFVVTFDDGYKDLLQVKDYLPSLGIYPTVFALSDTLHPNRGELETDREFLNGQELLMLKQAGWEIGSHSATHPDFSRLNFYEVQKEVMDAKVNLQTQLGIPIDYFAYPKGRYTSGVLDMVKKAGFKLAVTMDDGFMSTATDPYRIPRIGVDRTHKFSEFLGITSSLAIKLRRLLRRPINA